jgi:hypothetical protein
MKKKTKKTIFNAGLDKVGFIEARGFNPGNRPKLRRALKGRQIDWAKNVQKECNVIRLTNVHPLGFAD